MSQNQALGRQLNREFGLTVMESEWKKQAETLLLTAV